MILAMFSKAPFEWCWASACQWHRAGKPPELLCSRVPLAEDFGLEVWDHFRLSSSAFDWKCVLWSTLCSKARCGSARVSQWKLLHEPHKTHYVAQCSASASTVSGCNQTQLLSLQLSVQTSSRIHSEAGWHPELDRACQCLCCDPWGASNAVRSKLKDELVVGCFGGVAVIVRWLWLWL